MSERINNKIIAISGEPVSGKGTTVKTLVEKLKEQGYLKENIHIISTGDEFRVFFNNIINFIKNIEQPDILKELGETRELKQIIANKEYRKILESTIAQIKKSKINLESFTIANANNNPAFEDIRRVVDSLIDENIERLGIDINKVKRKNEIWIVDSRLAFHNIPHAFSVRLTTKSDVAAQRLFNDNSRNSEDRYSSLKEAEKEREERRIGEVKRYKSRYGVDLENPDNYDLIIDTSYASVDDIANTILDCQKCYEEGKKFGKTWTSPLKLLPLQTIRETFSAGLSSGMTIEELTQEIKHNGYIPSEEIKVIEVDGKDYIIEGHHRNFASLSAGKTLVPYYILAKDDEQLPSIKSTARDMENGITMNRLYDHEEFVERKLRQLSGDSKKKFSYNDIYPGIVNMIKEKESNILE